MTTLANIPDHEGPRPVARRRRRHYGRHIAGLQLVVLGLPWILLWLLWPAAPRQGRRERTAPGRVAFVRFEPGQNLSYLMPDLFSRGQAEQPDDSGPSGRSVPTLGDSLGQVGRSLAWEPVAETFPASDDMGPRGPFQAETEMRGPTPATQPVFGPAVPGEPRLEITGDEFLRQCGLDLSDEARLVLATGSKSWRCDLRINIVKAPHAIHLLVERSSGDRARDRQIVSAVRQSLRNQEVPACSASLRLHYLAP